MKPTYNSFENLKVDFNSDIIFSVNCLKLIRKNTQSYF